MVSTKPIAVVRLSRITWICTERAQLWPTLRRPRPRRRQTSNSAVGFGAAALVVDGGGASSDDDAVAGCSAGRSSSALIGDEERAVGCADELHTTSASG